jgi:hypothetical protein
MVELGHRDVIPAPVVCRRVRLPTPEIVPETHHPIIPGIAIHRSLNLGKVAVAARHFHIGCRIHIVASRFDPPHIVGSA